MTKWIASLVLAFMIAMSIPAANAHEAHRADMSDAELAEMKKAELDRHNSDHVDSADAAEQNNPVDAAASADKRFKTSADGRGDAAFSWADFLGRLHPALVHFPIALFIAAAIAELMLFMRPASGLETTVRFLIYTGAAGGLFAALLGWLAAGFRLSDRSQILGLHRWVGTGIAVAGLLAAYVTYRTKANRSLLRFLVAGLAFALVFQGYLGAELSLGPNHLGPNYFGM